MITKADLRAFVESICAENTSVTVVAAKRTREQIMTEARRKRQAAFVEDRMLAN